VAAIAWRLRINVMSTSSWYAHFAKTAARYAARPSVAVIALGLVVVWAITGPLFDFSETWQLVINTGTTIITFLMVFLIQNTQDRDTTAIQVKLDELIRATAGAHNALLDIEELEEEKLDQFRTKYEKLASTARANIERGDDDIGTPDA
jgi:low affinity Fe/Cu permease